jgi:hypothetical protein
MGNLRNIVFGLALAALAVTTVVPVQVATQAHATQVTAATQPPSVGGGEWPPK